MALVVLKATPRPKPRAFPRTNPSYISTHYGDGYSTYRRLNNVAGVSGIQRDLNLSFGEEENPYSVLNDFAVTRSHWPMTSHSFDISDSPSICPPVVSIQPLMCLILSF